MCIKQLLTHLKCALINTLHDIARARKKMRQTGNQPIRLTTYELALMLILSFSILNKHRASSKQIQNKNDT
jgi:hypothetical protein